MHWFVASSGRGGSGRGLAGVCVSVAIRWLLALSCVACAVIDSNEATDSTPPFLAYTSGRTIYRVNVDGTSQDEILTSSGNGINKLGIDFDHRNGRLFWVDSTQLKIMSCSLNGSNVQTVASEGFHTLERLAYDWVTDKVYWSDYGAALIGIIDLKSESKTRMVLIQTGEPQQSRPRALALDPQRRNMYWIDWLDEQGRAIIEKASMDGRGRQVIVDGELSRPYDLTLDLTAERLYFIDGYRDIISYTNLDGSNRNSLYLFPSNIIPFALVNFGGSLYWTERRQRVITRLSLESGGSDDQLQLGNVTVMSVRPAGLVVVAANRQPAVGVNPCSTSGCSDICILSSNVTRGYRCACNDGTVLNDDQLICKGSVITPTTSSSRPTPTPRPPSTSAVILLPTTIPTSVTPDLPCPCMNGGICHRMSGSEFRCICPANYTGDICEKRREPGICDLPVISEPLCQNEATCVNTGKFEYTCICLPGYEGRYCEKRTNYGVCNETKPCFNDGTCYNIEDAPGYECICSKGFAGDNCTFAQLQDAGPAITPGVFVGVVAGFVAVVLFLILIIVCVFAMLKKQRNKNRALAESASSRSNSPMIKVKRTLYRSEETPSSTDNTSSEFWLASQPSVAHGHTNYYSQGPRRGPPPNLRAYSKAGSLDQISRESKVLTV